jgi:hypothetical protein
MMRSEVVKEFIALIESEDKNRALPSEFEMAYEVCVATDRIRFGTKATEMSREQSELLKDAGILLLDKLDRRETAERRFQDPSRSPHHSKPRTSDHGVVRATNQRDWAAL